MNKKFLSVLLVLMILLTGAVALADLEYADEVSLARAFVDRKTL